MSEELKGTTAADASATCAAEDAAYAKHRFFGFYRSRRPELFSDTEERYELPLTRELFCFELEHLSTEKKQACFENFVVAVARRLITPNIKPQTGPDGGGDGKVDAETYEVSKDISDKWYAEECGACGKEKWAFTISCKSKWKEKIIGDVKKVVETKRGYTRILCFSSRPIKASMRSDLEETLTNEHGIKVDVFDASWCRDAVFQNGCLDIALKELGFSDEYKRKSVKIGSRDVRRRERLEAIERSIKGPVDGLNTDYVEALEETCILSRALALPRTEVEGRFVRAIRECEQHGTAQQRFNIIYDHAWTSLFWFEDCDAALADYNELKPFIETDCSVARLEKLTNILTILTAARQMGVVDIELSQEWKYVEQLEKNLEQDPNRQSCVLFLKLLKATQRLIWETKDEVTLKAHLSALKPLVQASSLNLEIGFETYYDILKEMAQRFGGNPFYEEYLDDLTDLIAKRDSEVAAARKRLDRAQEHFDASRYKDAIRQLGFCLYAFEKESCLDELIQSSGMMGMSLWTMRLPYSAEAYLVKAVFLLVKRFRTSGEIPHLLISTLCKLCEIELMLGRIAMYLNWRWLLNVFAQNGDYGKDCYFVEQMHVQDGAWACRLSECDLNDPLYARLPNALERNGLYIACDQLKFMLGHGDCIEAQMREVLKQWQSKFCDQPVFDQFLADINISRQGRACLKTTVKNFTFKIEYENCCALQQIAELFLASMESLMCTYDEFELIPRQGIIKIDIKSIDGPAELKALDADDEYQLTVGQKGFSDESLWVCLSRFIAYLFSRNAAHVDNISEWFDKKQQGERMMDRVSILQRTHIAMIGTLGESFKYKLEDWIDEKDAIYTLKSDAEPRKPVSREYGNRDQQTMQIRPVSKYSSAWEEAGWLGGFYCMGESQPPYLGLVFKNVDKVTAVIDDWGEHLIRGEHPITVYIIRGVSAHNPMWYRIGIVPGDLLEKKVSGQKVMMECKRHTLTPETQNLLNAFESEYRKYGMCWLMVCQGSDNRSGSMPTKFSKGIRFANVEFRDAWEISCADAACLAIAPDDDILIPDEHKTDAPVLAVLEAHRRTPQNETSCESISGPTAERRS